MSDIRVSRGVSAHRIRPLAVAVAILAMVSGLLLVATPADAGTARSSARAADVLANAASRAQAPGKAVANAQRAKYRIASHLRRATSVRRVADGVNIRVNKQRRCVTWTNGQPQVWPMRCKDIPAPGTPGGPSKPGKPGGPGGPGGPTKPPTTPTPPPSTPSDPGNPIGSRPAFGFYPGNMSDDPSANEYSMAATTSKLGAPGVVRVFFPGLLPSKFAGTKADVGVPVVVSFKADPAGVAAGAYDDQVRSFLSSVPAGRQVWWSFYHEPEDNIERGEFTFEQYRAAWAHLIAIAPKAANLHPTLILMRWDLTIPSRRPIGNYVVPGLEVLAWDAYIGPNYATAADAYRPAAAVSRSFGLDFAVAETSIVENSPSAANRPAIVKGVTQIASEQGAAFVTWFETNKSDGDWRLSPYSDAAAVWRQMTHPTS